MALAVLAVLFLLKPIGMTEGGQQEKHFVVLSSNETVHCILKWFDVALTLPFLPRTTL